MKKIYASTRTVHIMQSHVHSATRPIKYDAIARVDATTQPEVYTRQRRMIIFIHSRFAERSHSNDRIFHSHSLSSGVAIESEKYFASTTLTLDRVVGSILRMCKCPKRNLILCQQRYFMTVVYENLKRFCAGQNIFLSSRMLVSATLDD